MTRFLMLCHDQDIDRRILAQVRTLRRNGHHVEIVALAHGPEDSVEDLDGVRVHRIGLHGIRPENVIYRRYCRWQDWILATFYTRPHRRWPRMAGAINAAYRTATKCNSLLYQASLLLYYRGRSITDPLPFRSAFYQRAEAIGADAMFVHDLPALQAGAELAAAKRIPLVYDAHELYPEQRAFSGRQRRICAENERRYIKHAARVFTVNESIAEEMVRRYGIEKPTVVLNALDPPAGFEPGAGRYDLLRPRLGLAPGWRLVLFQGGLSRHRNLHTLVEAMRHVVSEDTALVFLGSGPLTGELTSLAERRGLLGRCVYFVPAVSQDELLAYTASADLGVIPYTPVDLNSYFCTPNKLFEFVQAGLPILGNDSPELRRFIVGYGLGAVIDMDSPRGVARAIESMMGPERISVLKRQVLNVRPQFTWRSQEKTYLRTLATIPSQPSQGLPTR